MTKYMPTWNIKAFTAFEGYSIFKYVKKITFILDPPTQNKFIYFTAKI